MVTQQGKRRVVSNIVIMASGQIATWLISTLHLVLVSRYLHALKAGQLTSAGYIVSLLGLIVSLGMGTVITRAVARDPARAGALVSAAMLAQSVLGIAAIVVTVLYVHILRLDPTFALITYIAVASMLIGSIGGVVGAAFAGREQMSFGVFGAIVGNVLDLAFLITIIKLNAGIVAFAVEGLILTFIGIGINAYFMRGNVWLTRHITWRDMHEVVVGGLVFWLGGVFLTIYFYVDGVLLLALTGSALANGYYGPAQRMFGVVLFLPGIITGATFPLLSRLGVNVGEDFERVNRKIISLLIACSIPMTIGIVSFAQPLILTIYGRDYAPAADVLVVLGLCTPFTYLDAQFSQMLAARDQQWRWAAALAASCVINPLLNFVAVPYAMRHGTHNATVGAAAAVLVTEALMTVYGVVLLRNIVLTRGIVRIAAGALLAGAAQWGVIALSATLSLWSPLGQALGLAAYGLVALLLGVFAREDLAYLWQTATGQLGGRFRQPASPVVANTIDGAAIAERLPPAPASEQLPPVLDNPRR